MTAEGMVEDDGCPSEEDLLAHVSGSGAHNQKLLAHVDGCDGCRLLLAEATRALSALSGAVAGPPAAHTLTAGERVLDRYAIRRFIARGGMGEVYEALDVLLDERVALKTLAASILDDDRAALRFKGEARLARRVNHPNVCRILEFGVHARVGHGRGEAEAIPFLTMEFLSGETLAQRLRRHGRLSAEEVVPVLRQVIAGLEAIHRAGVVHRDLKTENVFLVADGRQGERAVVMDFGLARALDGSVLTTWPARVGGMTGTLECMAPEQIEGATVGPPADVYALGVLMFEVLTGQRPFTRVSAAQRLLYPAPLASSRLPTLAAAWDPVIARCLALRPADRFPSLDALAAALPAPR